MNTYTETGAQIAARSHLQSLTVWQLARLAECTDPDSPTSAGADMLTSVRDDIASRYEFSGEITDDDRTAIADDAPNIYTHQRWLEFVDLAAYNEDVTEYGDLSDLTAAAAIALATIAERLISALVIEYEEHMAE